MKVVRTRNEIVTDNYEYAIKCLAQHGLDVDEYHGDICIELCKLASIMGDVPNYKIRSRLHGYINRLIQRKSDCEEVFVSEFMPDVSPMVFDRIECQATLDWVFENTKQYYFSQRCVDMLRMYYYDGYTYKEIAEVYNITATTVHNVIARGIRCLRHPSRSYYLRELLDCFE